MMRSMTGFGRASGAVAEAEIGVEIRTVNSRYLDIHLHLPQELAALESPVRETLRTQLKRGRADAFVSFVLSAGTQFELNQLLAEQYRMAARQLSDLGVKGELHLGVLLQVPGILEPAQVDFSSPPFLKGLLDVVGRALTQASAERIREGAALRKDMEKRLEVLRTCLQRIEPWAGRVSQHHRLKLEQRARVLAGQVGLEVDDGRLTQELLFYCERSDISEELTRLGSHVNRFQALIAGSEHNSIGKNLDFLCQEMNREMNTILSKACLAEISEVAVEGKVEIEKIREQVQNVE
ncbi:MAG: YicC/YloC family endoribonuclease [Acidobacteriota bacterium]